MITLTTVVIVLWIVLAILLVQSSYELNDTIFYILLFSIPSFTTLHAANAVRRAQKTTVNGNFFFNSLAAMILVDFMVLFVVYMATFNIG